MQKRVGIFAVIAFSALPAMASAGNGYLKVKATGSIETRSKNPSIGTRRKAIEDGRVKALERFIAEQDTQRARLLNGVRGVIVKDIDKYAPDVSPLGAGYWQDGYWKIDVEVSINETQIENLISQKTNVQGMAEKGGDYLTFVFVAREVDSVKTYKAREVDRVEQTRTARSAGTSDESVRSSRIEQATDDSTEALGEGGGVQGQESERLRKKGRKKSQETVAVEENTTEGSAEKKSERISYRAYSPDMVETKVTEIFSKAGIEVIAPFEAQIDPERFQHDFAQGNDISGPTKFHALEAARGSGISYLAVGTLDVGREETDAATGLQKKYVMVTAYVLNVKGKFSKRIASVGPVQYSGLGENPEVAKVNALVAAATAASIDLVDQLRVKMTQ